MLFKKNGAHNGTGKHYYLHYILHHFRLYVETKIHHQHGIQHTIDLQHGALAAETALVAYRQPPVKQPFKENKHFLDIILNHAIDLAL